LRILLIANFVPDQQVSMQLFSELLSAGLVANGYEVEVLRPDPFFVRLVNRPSGIRKWLGYIDKFILFPFVLMSRVKRYDVIHICDHSNSIYTAFLRDKPNLVTCHDLIAVRSALGEIPENPTGRSGRILQRAILRGLQRAQLIACVSEHTRRDVIRISRVKPSVTTCVHNGLNYPYAPMDRVEARSRASLLVADETRPFFLHVGGNQWYKNRVGVLEIFAHLHLRPQFSGYRLIMVGKSFTEEMRKLIEKERLGGHVAELTQLPNEDLRAFYSLAEGFIFPSLDEGFGWPIVEAQACGCPVFTSNRSPMTDIGGAAAVFLDPLNPGAAADEVAKAFPRRAELIQSGLENARRFDAAPMLEAYGQMYRSISAASSRIRLNK
jgi:glycosyltransferase involved in cell wall biosynthesis